jgi:hypothetical protein
MRWRGVFQDRNRADASGGLLQRVNFTANEWRQPPRNHVLKSACLASSALNRSRSATTAGLSIRAAVNFEGDGRRGFAMMNIMLLWFRSGRGAGAPGSISLAVADCPPSLLIQGGSFHSAGALGNRHQ